MNISLVALAFLALATSTVCAQPEGVALESISAKPTILQEVGCMGSDRQLCNATWVYCIDSYCDAPEMGSQSATAGFKLLEEVLCQHHQMVEHHVSSAKQQMARLITQSVMPFVKVCKVESCGPHLVTYL